MKNQPLPSNNMQVSVQDAAMELSEQQQGMVRCYEQMPSYAVVLLKKIEELEHTTNSVLTEAVNGIKHEVHINKDELLHGVSQACMRATHAEEVSLKMAAECHELRTQMTQQQHIIDAQDAQLRLWQMQSEQDKPSRAGKLNTLYIAPSCINNAPFSAEQMEYSQATITTEPNTRGGVEVQFTNKEECVELLKEFPNTKNTKKPYRATYARTLLQQRRDRLYFAIKQRLPRGMSSYQVKGQLYITNAAVSLAKKEEAPSGPYPSWLHAKTGPAGMDIGEPINLESVPQYARQVIELAAYKYKQKEGITTHRTPMRTLTDDGIEADISDVEMADRAARGRRSPTGETPGAKRATKK